MRRLAILFAINLYPRRVARRLYGPTGDALAFSQLLRSPRGGTFADEEVIVRLDGNAKWEEFESLLDGVAALGAWDEILICLGGHGGTRGFVFHDGEVPYQWIAARLRRIQARFKLVVVDACLSGPAQHLISGFAGIEKYASALASQRIVAAFADACPGVRVITAADKSGLAPDRPSLLRYMIHGIETAFPDRRYGVTSARRVFNIACTNMLEALGENYPVPGSSGDLSDYPLAVSDAVVPFGKVDVIAGPGWTSNWGTVQHSPISVTIRDRRFLATGIRVMLETRFGTSTLVEREVRPESSCVCVGVPVRFSQELSNLPGARLLVEVLDQYGRRVGPLFSAPLTRPALGLSAFV